MTEQNFDQMRRSMVVSQLRTTGVNDPRVVAAMGDVPRERFVPRERMDTAYADALIPLPGGRALNTPMALGRMLAEARLGGDERALVIGSATGYAAAVTALLVRSVVALEEDSALAATARSALVGSGVECVEGPLNAGWAQGAPYEFILIDGAVETLPQQIIDQLADGGQLAAALIDNGVARLSVGRMIGGALGTTVYADVAAPVLPGFAKPRGFSF